MVHARLELCEYRVGVDVRAREVRVLAGVRGGDVRGVVGQLMGAAAFARRVLPIRRMPS